MRYCQQCAKGTSKLFIALGLHGENKKCHPDLIPDCFIPLPKEGWWQKLRDAIAKDIRTIRKRGGHP